MLRITDSLKQPSSYSVLLPTFKGGKPLPPITQTSELTGL